MAYPQRDGKNVTWIIDTSDGKVSTHLKELSQIFAYYAKTGASELNTTFIMQMMDEQTRALVTLARQQEEELKRLRAMERDIEALKRDMADIKAPGFTQLEKPGIKKPQNDSAAKPGK